MAYLMSLCFLQWERLIWVAGTIALHPLFLSPLLPTPSSIMTLFLRPRPGAFHCVRMPAMSTPMTLFANSYSSILYYNGNDIVTTAEQDSDFRHMGA